MTTPFDHIYWLGGSPCAGKSSIAHQLADQFGLHLYHCDTEFERQRQQATAVSAPTIHHLHQLTCDELWLRPVAEQLQTEIAYQAEQFELILADLRQLPRKPRILVEGAVLMPTAVSPHLSQPHQAIWLVPTEPFQRLHYAQRPWIHDVLRNCTQPEQAFENWMQRDAAFARWVQQETAVRQLNCLVVDGQQTIAETSRQIAHAFGLQN